MCKISIDNKSLKLYSLVDLIIEEKCRTFIPFKVIYKWAREIIRKQNNF